MREFRPDDRVRRREFIAGLAAGTAVRPVAAKAQQPGRVYRLAIAHPSRPAQALHGAGAISHPYGRFFDEMRRLGYVEGQNLSVEAYSGEGKTALFPALAAKVVATKPDAILTFGDLDPPFKAATTTAPIVAFAGDDVLSGFVTDFAHPGGNITGVAVSPGVAIWGKRVALLAQAAPAAKRISFLCSRAQWDGATDDQIVVTVKAAARTVGVSLVPALIDAASDAEYRRAFAAITAEKPEALLLGGSAEEFAFASLLAELSIAARLPSLFPDRSFAEAGGMMSYGIYYPDLFRHAADDVARIFAGARPGDIPFYQPTRYELVINLKTAHALGVTIPPMLQAGADDLIE